MNTKLLRHLITLLFLTVTIHAFSSNLSQNAQISLLTQDKGDEMYAFFGHTAIRIKDDSLRIDLVYNYGTFNFNTPNFYIRFIRGDLDYCLSIDDFDYFVDFSSETKRTIHEQVLILTYEEKVKMLELLETCYTTSARYYRYDFLKNNCATKIRDIIEDATNKRIDFSTSEFEGMSFRQLLKPYVARNYWIDLGFNILLGMESDKAANPADYMFLPIYIHDFLENSNYSENSYILLDASPTKNEGINFSYILPWIIFVVLVVLNFWKKSRKGILFTISIIFGLFGILISFLSIYSLHPALGNNLNVLWTLPAFMILFFRKKRINEYFKIVYILIIALFIALQGIIPQELSPVFIPWMIILMIINITDLKIIKARLYKSN
jgi:hypothetical protein